MISIPHTDTYHNILLVSLKILNTETVQIIFQVRQIFEKSIGDFTTAEFWTMLKFYHDIGQIVCFDGEMPHKILADHCWLMKLFEMLVAVPEPKDEVNSL